MSTLYTELWSSDQNIIVIGEVRLGGYPGLNPALLVASLFYQGDKYLLSEDGVIDKGGVSKAIEYAQEIADKYGLYLGLDIIFPTEKSVENILPFISEYELPIFLDSPDPRARIKAYRLARELGITSKCIANGLYVDSSIEEINEIRDSGLENVLLLVFDPMNPSKSIMPKDRYNLLTNKLLPMARKTMAKNILIDAIVLDPASIVFSAETIFLVKKNLGFPAGCAPVNALGPISKKNVELEEIFGVHGSVAVLLRIYGADFIMYGPIKRIKYVAPAVATADSLLAYSLRYQGYRLMKRHPITKILRRIQKLFVSS